MTQQIILDTLEDAYKLELEAERLTQKAAELLKTRDEIIQEHIRADQLEEGPFRIHREYSARRTVNMKRVKELFPIDFEKMKEIKETITVKAAEKYFAIEDHEKIFETNIIEKISLQYMIGGGYI